MKFAYLISLFFSWALACSSGGGNSSEYDRTGGKATVPSMDQGEMSGGAGQGKDLETVEAKVIRDGRMTINVEDINKAKLFVDGVITKYNARTSGEQFENNDYQATYYIRVRVPAARLDSLVNDLRTMEGEIVTTSIDARDVTEEYIDLETRLENKRQYLEQYRQLLKTTKTTEDVLKVTEQIRLLEEELESVQGRLKYLADQVALSTLELSLVQTKDYVYKPDRSINFFERLKESLSGGWYGFVNFLLFSIALWPFILIILLVIFLFRRYRRRRKGVPPKPV